MPKSPAGGYCGKILRVDLSSSKTETIPLDWSMARKFIGGRGLGAALLYRYLPEGVDPLSPENILIFITGPVNGTPFFGDKYVVLTKSPLTGAFLDSYCGGHFGAELKFAGFDGAIIQGKAPNPVYIWVKDGHAEIRDASPVWGKGCFESEEELKRQVGEPDARVAVIGPAGENLVRFAHIATDYYHSAGRGGTGTVMGSKNLKALIVRGTGGVTLADPKGFLTFVKSLDERLNSDPFVHDRVQYGTPLSMVYTQASGILPTRNFSAGQFEGASDINGYAVKEKVVVKDRACYACSIPCGKLSEVREGPFKGSKVVGPEYETLCMFGSNCGINDLGAIVRANELCDDLGLDSISCGGAVAFATECYKRGLISSSDTGGIALDFGDGNAVTAMIRKISSRQDIGDLLAEGVQAAARRIGQGSKDFAIHGKGLELPAYDPRGSPAFALAMAIADRGACHRRSWPVIAERKLPPLTTEGRAKLVKGLYDERIPMHCAATCDFVGGRAKMGFADFARVFSLVTGWEFTEKDMQELADRVAAMCLLFNLREDAPFTREDNLNYLPKRLTSEPSPVGPAKGQVVSVENLSIMLDDYYALRGWDPQNGYPLRETLKRLGIDEYANIDSF